MSWYLTEMYHDFDLNVEQKLDNKISDIRKMIQIKAKRQMDFDVMKQFGSVTEI